MLFHDMTFDIIVIIIIIIIIIIAAIKVAHSTYIQSKYIQN